MKKLIILLTTFIFNSSSLAQVASFQGNWLMDNVVCIGKDGSQQTIFKYTPGERPSVEMRLSLDAFGAGQVTTTNYGPTSQCSGTANMTFSIQGDKLVTTRGPFSWSGDLSNGCEVDQTTDVDTVRFSFVNGNNFQIHNDPFGPEDTCADRVINFIRQ